MHSPIPLSSVETLHNLFSAISAFGRPCLFASAIALAVLAFPLPTRGQNGNVAYGPGALDSVTTGNLNTAIGADALTSDTAGYWNTAIGADALKSNKTGNTNTASGTQAMLFNTTGTDNTATGTFALVNNLGGNLNTATGAYALHDNQSGGGNTSDGYQALLSNRTGSFNTANGFKALFNNVTAFWNTANGYQALYNASGSFNIAVGANAGFLITTGSSNIDIGNAGVAGDTKKIRIGTKGTHDGTFIAGISGVAVTGTQVVVNTNGKLAVTGSSARFKDEIKPMDKASEAMLALKPVTFRYKEEIDPDSIPQFGLVAEEVEKVNPDLVARDAEGKVYTMRYEAVNAMLLNEFLKEHRRVEEQRNYFEAKIAQQQNQIEALTATVQKVRAQIALAKPAPQLVANP
jgi:Chaperone of endosialidase